MNLQTDGLATIANLLTETVQQFVVRPAGIANQRGVSGFVFHVLDQEEVANDSEITDHYVEDNSAIQDHIALKAERYTVRGYIGELNNVLPFGLAPLLEIIQTLSTVPSFSPVFVQGAIEIYRTIEETVRGATQVVKQAESVYSLFQQKSTTSSQQQNAFNYFNALWKARQFCTIETPYNILDNMAIESVRSVQTGQTKSVSDFQVTFKKIRIVQTLVARPGVQALDRVANMLSSIAEKGKSTGQVVDPVQLDISFGGVIG